MVRIEQIAQELHDEGLAVSVYDYESGLPFEVVDDLTLPSFRLACRMGAPIQHFGDLPIQRHR